MDGDRLNESFNKNKGKINSYYNTEEGDKKLFFEAIQKYDTTDSLNKTGLTYDIYMRMFKEEGNYDKLIDEDEDFKKFDGTKILPHSWKKA